MKDERWTNRHKDGRKGKTLSKTGSDFAFSITIIDTFSNNSNNNTEKQQQQQQQQQQQ